jgi:hypothetical protein
LKQDGYPGRDIRSGWPYILGEEKKIQIKIDGLPKNPRMTLSVIPAEAGIQSLLRESGLPPESTLAKAEAGVTRWKIYRSTSSL